MVSNFDHGQAISQISQGNYDAKLVCFEIFSTFSLPDSERIFQAMIDKNLTGSSLWYFFRDEAQEQIVDLVSLILNEKVNHQ